MRAGGARVGVGDLLAAHRALAAVDAADARGGVLRAARGAVLLARRHGGVRRGVRARLRRARGGARRTRSRRSAQIERDGAAAARHPGRGPRRRPSSTSRPCPPPGARRSCCASATSRSTPTPSARPRGGCWPGSRAAGRSASRAARAPTRRRREVHDLRATSGCRCATAASSSSAATARPAERPRRLVLVCDVSGSMAPVRADAAAVPAGGASRRARASRRSCSARG